MEEGILRFEHVNSVGGGGYGERKVLLGVRACEGNGFLNPEIPSYENMHEKERKGGMGVVGGG